MCEMLASAGAEVRGVATTASERTGHADPVTVLQKLNIHPDVHPGRQKGSERPVVEFHDRGIHYTLLDVGPRAMHAWQKIVGDQFDRLFDRELHQFRPDLPLGFGGLPGDQRRYQRARNQGVRMVFSLRNEGYLNDAGRELLSTVDGILTCSQYLTNLYRSVLDLEST